MAKTTSRGSSYTGDEQSEPDPVIRIRRAEIGMPVGWVGTRSRRSTRNNRRNVVSENKQTHSPAPTTENHSDQLKTDDPSNVPSTDGSTQPTELTQSDSTTPPKKRTSTKASKRARTHVITDEDDDF